MRFFFYRISRALLRWWIRPQIAGLAPADLPESCVYVLPRRGVSDLIVLDLVTAAEGLPRPLEAIEDTGLDESRSFLFLTRPTGFMRRNTMLTPSTRLVRIMEETHLEDSRTALQPVQIFWGRAHRRDRSFLKTLFSEDWAVTSRLKRFLNVIISRKHIVAHFGDPLPLAGFAATEENRRVRRAARLVRVQFRNQKIAKLGPDYSHRRTLVDEIVASTAVQQAIAEAAPEQRSAQEKLARKHAMTIASDMSYPTIRILESALTWFWNHIYDGVEVRGIEQVRRYAETHTMVYVPSHRSHVDYLLLSYLLFHNDLMIPHIAAGDNLNLPVLGGILRGGGAFFMRRSFRDDALYRAVFAEYLYQVYQAGHPVEFFPEGGRTRTGRLLPARTGLLQMTLRHAARGLPKPIALVPVYFGYEKLIEAGSYLDELRGGEKRSESMGDVFRSLRLIRQDFGRVEVNFAEPLDLAEWQTAHARDGASGLGRELLQLINANASVNPVNLVALVVLATPRLAIGERDLVRQIACYQRLLAGPSVSVTEMDADEVIDYVQNMGMLNREEESFGHVLCLEPFAAVLMTWYRNNVAHLLAVPSLIACLLASRNHAVTRAGLERMVEVVYPYLAHELHGSPTPDTRQWLDVLEAEGLVECREQTVRAPETSTTAHYQLHLLGRVVMQTLERLYIVISLLAGERHLTRSELQARSQLVAHEMARFYGINAPEFFDQRLFNTFVDQLIADGTIHEREDDTLSHAPIVEQVVKAAERVIDPELRYAITRS